MGFGLGGCSVTPSSRMMFDQNVNKDMQRKGHNAEEVGITYYKINAD